MFLIFVLNSYKDSVYTYAVVAHGHTDLFQVLWKCNAGFSWLETCGISFIKMY